MTRGWLLWLAGLVAALVLAGGISFYASASPDGLEWVAEEIGFAEAGGDHALGDGPLADYQLAGVEDERLAGGLAGVVGTAVVLVAASGLVWAVRRPRPHAGAPRETGTP